MKEHLQFYIDGQWTDPVTPRTLDVINPSTEEVASRISLGSAADVDKAVQAARRWKFNPETRNGQKVASRVRVPVDFTLQG